MPQYQFVCRHCDHSETVLMSFTEHDALERDPETKSAVLPCPKCKEQMRQNIGTTHTVIDRSWDGKNPGKVFQEHNEKLKKREGSGYDYLTPTQKIRERHTGDRFRNR